MRPGVILAAPIPAEPDPAARNIQGALQLLQALRQNGLQHLVLCPGSRSGPLAVAAGLLADRHGLGLHTAIDERSAAFFALGHAHASGRPSAVVTTSGTAVANLLPAVVEADYGTIPLLLLTADRPARLKGCGANQTVNQEQFLAANVRWMAEADPRGVGAMATDQLTALATLALQCCLGGAQHPPGPVHLNLPFEEPLHGASPCPDRPVGSPELATAPTVAALGEVSDPVPLDPDRPGLVIAGPWRGSPQAWPGFVAALRRWQRRTGWPVIADALSCLRGIGDLQLVASYDLIADNLSAALGAQQAALQVLRLGPLPASRRLQQFLQRCHGTQLLLSEGDNRPLDPLERCHQQACCGLEQWLAQHPGAWLQGGPSRQSLQRAADWHGLDEALQPWLDQQLGADAWGEPTIARALAQLLPAELPLVLANSSPVRDWETFMPARAPWRRIHAFRGASGIDGTLSIACGVAAATGAAALVTGDLALLHDSNGWLWRSQLTGSLAVILLDNGGGGIFEQLPIRPGLGEAEAFERLFAMPQQVDQAALAAAHGIPSQRVDNLDDLPAALRWALNQQPMALLVLPTDRRADAAQRHHLRKMALDFVRRS